MKRSEINQAIRDARALFASHRFLLPPFADWTPERWRTIGPEAGEIRRAGLGWDVTDFAAGDFAATGLTLFTVRNGVPGDPASKTYCEKIMMVGERQVTPLHFHYQKMEDIINRGGGRLALRFFRADDDEGLDKQTPVDLSVDGVVRTLAPGETLVLEPGQSVSIPQRVYHDFWAVQGHGPVMAGEVSAVNDDQKDNRFFEPLGRFPEIEEDEAAEVRLVSEYA